MPAHIEIQLSQDRRQPGVLVLRNVAGAVVAGPFSAGGIADSATATAHGNPDRSTIVRYGSTPTGTYSIEKTVPTGDGTSRSAHSYGPNGAIVLIPTSGDASLAAAAGRTGLLIHGGDPSGSGGLRPTHGCIRLSNGDMKQLLDAITFLMVTEAPPDGCAMQELPVVEIADGATIDTNDVPGDDEDDPPPTDGAGPPILP